MSDVIRFIEVAVVVGAVAGIVVSIVLGVVVSRRSQ
jgi:hypothetical protein